MQSSDRRHSLFIANLLPKHGIIIRGMHSHRVSKSPVRVVHTQEKRKWPDTRDLYLYLPTYDCVWDAFKRISCRGDQLNGQPEPKWTDDGATFDMNGLVPRETRVATLIFVCGLSNLSQRGVWEISKLMSCSIDPEHRKSHCRALLKRGVVGATFCSPLSLSASFWSSCESAAA